MSHTIISSEAAQHDSGDCELPGADSRSEKPSHSTLVLDGDSIQNVSLSRTSSFDRLRKAEKISQPKTRLKTPATILIPYLLSIVLAVLHLGMAFMVNGRRADGPHQGYVNTASQALAQMFNIIILISLGTAYSQCLWRIARKYYVQMDTLDKLFTMKSDPLALFSAMITRHAWRHWSLMLLSITILGTQIAVIFPVGAITTQPMAHNMTMNHTHLPTFNPADLGDGCYDSINEHSVILFTPCSDNSSQSRAWLYKADRLDPFPSNPSLTRVAERTMMGHLTSPLDTPQGCRSNCSYSIQFLGPFLQCSATKKDLTLRVNASDIFDTVYQGTWTNQPPENLTKADRENPNSVAKMEFTTRVLNRQQAISGTKDHELDLTETNTSCTPMKANYTVLNTWINSTYSPSVQVSEIRPLMNVAKDVPWQREDIINKNNTTIVEYIQDSNILAIIQAMFVPLTGTYKADNGLEDDTATDDSWRDASWQIGPAGKIAGAKLGVSSGFIVDFTPLFTRWNQSNTIERYIPVKQPFIIDPDILNSFLKNITLSVISSFSLSNGTAFNATSTPYINTFVFSNKPSLIVPYFITLGASLPFIILSLYALWENGATATDGSLLQSLVTTQGSKTLTRLARRDASRGVGAEEAADELKNTKVKYGVMVMDDDDHEDGDTAASGRTGKEEGRIFAGFGTEKEIVGELGRAHDRPTKKKERRKWTMLELGSSAGKEWRAVSQDS